MKGACACFPVSFRPMLMTADEPTSGEWLRMKQCNSIPERLKACLQLLLHAPW